MLEYSGLTWDHLTAKVKEAVGESNVALAARVIEVVQKVVKGGDGMVALLKEEAFGLTPEQLLDEALRIGLEQITRVFVPKAVEFLMTKLVVPASGVLVALYDGLRWLADNATAMGQVGTKILEGMEALASGSPEAVQGVARAVKTAFDDMIVPGLDFVAKQAKLDGVKAAAVAAIGGVKTKVVDPRLRQFLTALVNKLKAAIGIQPGESTQQAGQIGPRVEKMVQGVKYQLWVAVRSGQTVIMVARQGGPTPAGGGRTPNQSTPGNDAVELERLELTEQLLKNLSPQARAQVQAAVAEVISKAKQAQALLNQKGKEAESAKLQASGGPMEAANASLLRCLETSGGLATMFRSGACFAAGTPMRTVDGSVPIEQLRPGDYILSRDEHHPDSPVSARQVEEVFAHHGYVLDLRVQGHLIRTTEEHPFYRAGDGWVAAWELGPGDQLVGQGGQLLEVESVTQTGIVETVYNVRVADHHTYFVGTDEWGFAVWAHNSYAPENAVAAPYSQSLSMTDRTARLLRNRALYYRISQGVSETRNVAVILFRRDGQLYTRAYQSTGGHDAPYSHAEYIGLNDLVRNRGINRSDIISIFTDRYPCSDCEPVLERFGFGAEGSSTFNSRVHWGICKYTREADCQRIIAAAVAAIQANGGINSLTLRDPVVGQWVNDNS